MMRRLFRLLIVWAVLPVSFVASADRNPRPETKRPFRENVTLPVNNGLLKQFGTVEDLLGAQRWSEAIIILQEIAQTDSKELVLVQPGKAGEVANYLNVATRCNVLLSRISAEGREAYRRKVDPQAKRWFESWQRTHDDKELLRIARQAYLSSFGDDALWALGEVAWDRGDFSTARLWWEQLIPLPSEAEPGRYPTVLRYPDSKIEPAMVLARMVLCSIVSKEPARALDELRQFTEKYPLAEGWLAGRHARFVETLQRVLEESKVWQSTPSPAEVATFGLSPERYQSVSETTDVGAFRWSRPLPRNLLPQKNNGSPFTTEPLSYHPVVYDKIVLVNDANAIRAWDILSGESAWQSEGRDPSIIYPSVPDEPKVISKSDCVGSPHYTMTIADNRLYARMGSPVTCSTFSEMRPEFPSDLVCLDLSQEGKLIWKVSATELLPDTVPWRFEGTPVVVSGRAYVALCRRNPQLELIVVSLDAADGRLLWQQSVGASRNSVEENTNRVSHLLLTCGGGRIFLSSDAGVIVALDAADGRLEWAVTYESRIEQVTATTSDLSRKSLHPPLFHAGFLFAAPSDASAAYCIEADSGRVRWQFPFIDGVRGSVPENNQAQRNADLQIRSRQWRHLLGVGPGGMAGRLIVSGNSLWAIDIETGTIAWPTTERTFPRGSNGEFGRGVIAGNQVLVPLRESIEIFDVESGDLVRSVQLKIPESPQIGGNLTLASGMLLVTQPTQLVAYSDFSRLKNQIQNKLIERQDDRRLRIQLAELERVEGSPDAAILEFRKILGVTGPEQPAYFTARRRLTTLYQQSGSAKLREGKLDEARQDWSEAISLADDIVQRVDLIFDLSRVEEALDRPPAAVAQLRQILIQKGLASVRRETSTAGDLASRKIWRLINERGRDVFRELESAASAELVDLRARSDRAGLQKFLTQYPHMEATVPARELLVKLYRQEGQFSEAFAVLNQARERAPDDESFIQATLPMIEMLEERQSDRLARQAWQELALLDSSTEVEFRGIRANMADLVRAKLAATVSEIRPDLIERAWQVSLPLGAQIVIPQGQPPSADLAAFLVCARNDVPSNTWTCECRDWCSGQVRWKETLSSPISIAGWTAVHLLIGTSHQWYGRDAENGRAIWEQISLPMTEPLLVRPTSFHTAHAPWPAFFDLQQGLQIFEPYSGRIVSVLKPTGQLVRLLGDGHPTYFAGPVDSPASRKEVAQQAKETSGRDALQATFQIYLLTERPFRLWKASSTTPFVEWTMQEIAEAALPWKGSLGFAGNHLVGLTADRFLAGIDLSPLNKNSSGNPFDNNDVRSRRDRWIFRNLPFGSADPVAISWFGKLLVIADGTQLASFVPTSGKRLWLAGMTNLPLEAPAKQICADEDHVYATSQGILRSISIHDGSVTHAKYLGNISEQWRTVVAWNGNQNTPIESAETNLPADVQTLIAAWPIDRNPRRPVMISIFSAKSGEIVQQVHADSCPRDLRFDDSGHGLLSTDQTVTGLRFSTVTSVTQADSVTAPRSKRGP